MAAVRTGTAVEATCAHCGTPIPRAAEGKKFCCNGCAYVYNLIHDEGLEQFYDLRDKPLTPVNAQTLKERDTVWLEEAMTAAETAQPQSPSLRMELQGISCVGCVWLIERLFQKRPGSRRIEVNAQLGQIRLEWSPGAFDAIALAQELQQHGYTLGPEGQPRVQESRRLVHRIGLCAAFAANTMLFTLPAYLGMEETHALYGLFQLLVVLFATLSFLTGGAYFIGRAWSSLRLGILSIDLPLALGITGAYVGSLAGWLLGMATWQYFDFVSIFTFLMLTGRWLQEAALERNRNALLSRSPRPHTVETDTGESLAVEQIVPGQGFKLLPNQVNPVCGRLQSEAAETSLEWINGESEARVFKRGQRMPAGAVLLGKESVLLEAEETWAESLLSRLLEPMQSSFRNYALERILRLYLCAVLALAVAGGLYWWLAIGQVTTSLQVVLSILVVSCPCGLGVAWPLADEWAVALLRRSGVFLREITAFARLRSIRQIIFDKTGTLTLEAPQLSNPEALQSLDEGVCARLREMTAGSLHPLSRSLYEAVLNQTGAAEKSLDSVEELPGLGVVAREGSVVWTLGRPGWRGRVETATGNWSHQCELARNGEVLAAFTFTEALRSDAVEEIKSLRERFRIYLLSGDRHAKVAAMADTLGLPRDDALGEQSPQDKEGWVESHEPEATLFVGDGANDSLAFNRAAVRLAPLTDRSVLEAKADFVFTGRGLRGIRALFAVAQKRHHILRRVFLFTVVYNLAAVSVCLMGAMNPLVAAIIMPLSSLLTVGLVAAGYGRRSL